MWDIRGAIIRGLRSVKHMSDMAFMAAPNHTKDAFPNEEGFGGFKLRPYLAGKGPP
jgi:hypothetical protein